MSLPTCCFGKIADISPSFALFRQFGTFQWSGIKFLIGNFTGLSIVNFIQDWKSSCLYMRLHAHCWSKNIYINEKNTVF